MNMYKQKLMYFIWKYLSIKP